MRYNLEARSEAGYWYIAGSEDEIHKLLPPAREHRKLNPTQPVRITEAQPPHRIMYQDPPSTRTE